MASPAAFMKVVSSRRTFYKLGNESTIADSKIEELVKETILHVPSSFNAQSTRLFILLHDEHLKQWTATKDILKPMIPADKFAATKQRIMGFATAYGTVNSSHPYDRIFIQSRDGGFSPLRTSLLFKCVLKISHYIPISFVSGLNTPRQCISTFVTTTEPAPRSLTADISSLVCIGG